MEKEQDYNELLEYTISCLDKILELALLRQVPDELNVDYIAYSSLFADIRGLRNILVLQRSLTSLDRTLDDYQKLLIGSGDKNDGGSI